MRHPTFLKFLFLIISSCGLFWLSAAEAVVRIHIDLSSQRMQVDANGGTYSWPVSTARSGYVTPRGSFVPESLQRMHYSKKYHMSPMPYSIFFAGGYAIHGTYETAWLGHPASHGCVRLSPQHAAILFQLVKAEGAKISITGAPPRTSYARSGRRLRSVAAVARPRPQQAFFSPFGRSDDAATEPRSGGWQSDPFWQ